MEDELRARLLGGFSLEYKDAVLPVPGRSKKLCLLLAVLLLEHPDPAPCSRLAQMLWKEQPPAAALGPLKALLHRGRTLLDQLFPGAGRALLASRDGCYLWSGRLPLSIDTVSFSQLIQRMEDAREEEARLALGRKALALYQGEFLPGLTGHPWVEERREALAGQYHSALRQTLPLLAARDQWQEILQLTLPAASTCDEEICRWRIQSFLRLGRRQQAAQAYEALHQRMLTQRKVLPSPELRALYREARREQDPQAVTPVTLWEQLREDGAGAFFCEYDFFQAICRIAVRAAQRTGAPLHAALLSLESAEGGRLAQFSLDRAMGHLQEILRGRLRRGDAFTRCSGFQFALLLPQADSANSRRVCQRIVRAFAQQYPHSPAVIQTAVFPLTTQE